MPNHNGYGLAVTPLAVELAFMYGTFCDSVRFKCHQNVLPFERKTLLGDNPDSENLFYENAHHFEENVRILMEILSPLETCYALLAIALHPLNSIIVDSPDPNNPVNQFHFMFLLPLRDVDKTSTIAELIISQHGKLEMFDKEFIQSVLEGQTNHKVLLLLDAYDEYTPGSNQHIDRAIEHSIGKCFLILTSRPGSESEGRTYIYVSKAIRDKMDGEVIIEGFSPENIVKCSTQYLDSKENSDTMLEQAKKLVFMISFECL